MGFDLGIGGETVLEGSWLEGADEVSRFEGAVGVGLGLEAGS